MTQRRTIKKIIFFVLALGLFFGYFRPPVVNAVDLSNDVMGQVNAGARGGELGNAIDPHVIISSVIKVFLGILGTVFFVLMIMSGYWLITARGNDEKQTKAMDTVRRATIGLILVLLAYGITAFVSNKVTKAVNGDIPGQSLQSSGAQNIANGRSSWSSNMWCGLPLGGFFCGN